MRTPGQREAALVVVRDVGARIEAVFNDDLVQRFFTDIRAKLVSEIVAAAPADHETRAACAFSIKVLDNLVSALVQVAATGERAEANLVELITKRQKNV